jgi:hypothetical protein
METDEIKTCAERDCSNTFTVTENEKEWFEAKGLQPPKRCRDCRAKLREKREQENQNNL